MKAGLEKVINLNAGDLAPVVNLSPKCHMAIQQVRPYTYNWSRKTQVPIGTYAAVVEVDHEGVRGPRHVREAARRQVTAPRRTA